MKTRIDMPLGKSFSKRFTMDSGVKVEMKVSEKDKIFHTHVAHIAFPETGETIIAHFDAAGLYELRLSNEATCPTLYVRECKVCKKIIPERCEKCKMPILKNGCVEWAHCDGSC